MGARPVGVCVYEVRVRVQAGCVREDVCACVCTYACAMHVYDPSASGITGGRSTARTRNEPETSGACVFGGGDPVH